MEVYYDSNGNGLHDTGEPGKYCKITQNTVPNSCSTKVGGMSVNQTQEGVFIIEYDFTDCNGTKLNTTEKVKKS
jgi:hypothetical protein